MSITPWPAGPYRFDDISSDREPDGLGYVYLADGGCSPTLAHTGDQALSAEENRALGHLLAAAPDMHDVLLSARDWLADAAGRTSFFSQAPAEIIELAKSDLARIDAALAKAKGGPS